MKLLAATAFFLAFAAYEVRSQACHMREMDLCMAVGMFQYQSKGVAADAERLDEWCETVKEVRECMGNYSEKCLSPVQRELTGLLSGSDTNARQLCVDGSEIRTGFLAHAECLSEGAETEDFQNILRDLQVFVEKVFKVEFEDRFPLFCCGIQRFRLDCKTMVQKRCGESSVKMFETVLQMVLTTVPRTICQRFDPESAECSSLLPIRGTSPAEGDDKSNLSRLLDTLFSSD